jgi:hypothetical protein
MVVARGLALKRRDKLMRPKVRCLIRIGCEDSAPDADNVGRLPAVTQAPRTEPAAAQQHPQHEPSHVLSSQHEHIPITSLPIPQNRRAPGARHRVRALRAGHRGQHPGQLGPQYSEPVHLLVDLGDVPAQQRLRRAARAGAGVADRQQLPDFRQPQPEPLRTADEQQPVHSGRVIPAVITPGPGRCGQQSGPLVVPDGVGTDPGPRCQLSHRQRPGDLIDAHVPTLNPGPYSKFKPQPATIADEVLPVYRLPRRAPRSLHGAPASRRKRRLPW